MCVWFFVSGLQYSLYVIVVLLQLIKNFYNTTYSARQGNDLQASADNGTTTVQGGGVDDFTLTFLWSLTTTLFVIGGMIGAYFAGFVANRVGRQVFFAKIMCTLYLKNDTDVFTITSTHIKRFW